MIFLDLIIALHPPYPVLVIAFMIAGYGNGLADAAWNAWIGNMEHANEILGFLHGLYGFGAVISPLVATTMVTKANLQWYTFYYVMVSFNVHYCQSSMNQTRTARVLMYWVC